MKESGAVTWPGWEVLEPIGRGSFGTVYKIRRDVYGDIEEAALKVMTIPHSEDELDYLRSEGLDHDSITKTFHRQVGEIAKEYNLMKQMRDNPNIVRCDDFRDIQHDDGLGWDIYIKMELLTPLMKALHLVQTEQQIIRFGMDMCNGLAACQERNIIHRDIKPQNVFASPNGQFKLGDFGIARTMERTTVATAGIGTYSYMAPEVFRGKTYNKTADIYSLGLMMYWLLNERRGPFLPLPPRMPTAQERDEGQLRRLSGEAIPAPKNGSKELKAIVLKACAFRPEDRFQSAEEMLNALRELGQKKPAPQPKPEPKPKPAPKPKPEPVPQPQPKPVKEDETVVEKPVPKPVRKPEPDPVPTPEPDDETVTETPVVKPEPNPEPIPQPRPAHGTVCRKCGYQNHAGETICGGCGSSLTDEKPKPPRKKKMWIPTVCACMGILILLIGFVAKGIGDIFWNADTVSIADEVEKLNSTHRKIVDISACADMTAVLYDDGTVAMAGPLNHSVEDWENIKKISMGPRGLLVLREDGTVIRSTRNGEKPITHSWEDIVDIAAGGGYEVGMKSDGRVVIYSCTGEKNTEMEWTDVIAVDAGNHDVLALKKDGTVVGEVHIYYEDWSDVVAISVGYSHTVALKSDGTVIAIGMNNYGECDISGWTDIVAIDAGTNYTVGLKADGTVVAVGKNENGQCDVSEWTDIVDISTGSSHTVGLKSDGTVVVAGS